jgi:hypothetical protein
MVRGCLGLVLDSISGFGVERPEQEQAQNVEWEKVRQAVEWHLLALELVRIHRLPFWPILEVQHNGAALRLVAVPAYSRWRWSLSRTVGCKFFPKAVEVCASSSQVAVVFADDR